ncbi:tigger transposable element-derived protein 6-like [Sparus aurata]|nr:tigger transposable element-derived protein 6-like [Sparus aurata]
MNANDGERKGGHPGKAPAVEAALVKCIDNARSRNAPLSGPLVREKAEALAASLREDGFKVSVGWFERFKKRENIVFKKLHGEAAEADTVSRDEWLEQQWVRVRQDYSEENIWNADETGIYFRALPDSTLTFKSDNKRGGKKSKERITALLACSAAGEKKELFGVGKSHSPRCFKHVRTLPVRYAANSSAWMTAALFVEWLKDWDRKLGQERKSILLLVDNCAAHNVKNSTLRNIRLEFLPKNTTSILRPCDQGIVRTTKTYFRKEMARSVLRQIDEGNRAAAADIAKKISLLDAILMLRDAWADVEASTIRNCWRKGGLVMSPEEEPTTVDPPAEISTDEFEQWILSDDSTPVSEPVTDEDIISEVQERFGAGTSAACSKEEEEDEEEETVVPSRAEMRNAICILKTRNSPACWFQKL